MNKYRNIIPNKFRGAALSLTLSLFLFSFLSSLPGVPDAAIKIKQKEPGLCYTCHEELEKSLSSTYTHFLFKEGKCKSCHDPHASDHRGLMKDEINFLCLNCHKRLRDLIEKTNTHGAVKQGICTDCHYAHSGENKHLLTKPSNELCWECHENLSEQLTQSYVHPQFEKGDCSSCHNAHASPEENLLREKPTITCKKCHGPRCTAGEVSIASVTTKIDCTSCHSGHSSKDKGLLGPFGHTAFLNKTCEECHEPILNSGDIALRIEGKDLCFSCHERETPTQFIDDDIHVKDAENPCLVCHGPHASNSESLTLNEEKLCQTCHESTEKSTAVMEKAIENADCSPINNRQCFKCHMLQCSSEKPLYYSGNTLLICYECHKAEHSISHPVGEKAIDPRDGKSMTCLSCHSMHSSRFDYMLIFEGDKALCIQCHRIKT
jgi:predicted CXXCH cytochrome family protein